MTSNKGKLRVLQKSYKDLGGMSEDSDLIVNGKSKLKLKSVCAVVYCVKMSI